MAFPRSLWTSSRPEMSIDAGCCVATGVAELSLMLLMWLLSDARVWCGLTRKKGAAAGATAAQAPDGAVPVRARRPHAMVEVRVQI
jgi:hypothetical protein